MTDLSHARRNAHRNTARTAAVRRLLSGKPKTPRDERDTLMGLLMIAEEKLVKAVWQDVRVYSKKEIAQMFPGGRYTMPVILPGWTPAVRHL